MPCLHAGSSKIFHSIIKCNIFFDPMHAGSPENCSHGPRSERERGRNVVRKRGRNIQTHTWQLDLDGKTRGTTTCLDVGR